MRVAPVLARARGAALALGLGGAFALAWEPAGAQDVEMLGRQYGTRPPAAYFEQLARDPHAYRFTRGRAGRIRAAGALAPGGAPAAGPLRAIGPRDGVVEGEFAIPVVLGLFHDSQTGGPYSATEIEAAYFGETPPPGRPGTVRTYYEEVSGGRVELDGEVFDWVQADLTREQVTRGDAALSPAELGAGGIGNFVYELLQKVVSANPDIDWATFDNDGDGYVDALAVIHPTYGAECGGPSDVIWSHKWSLNGAVGSSFETPSPGANGHNVRIDDYFVQPVLSCGSSELNEIGVFTHETGHAFGLPDLYDTRYVHSGAGNWDLMATGTWGCNGRSPEAPCHMGAWSKAMLGWVDVVTLDPGIDHGTLTLPPVASNGTVYRIDAQDGSDEYYLLETRTRGGPGEHRFDADLPAEGLLVWRVDEGLVASRWPFNAVNASDRMGVGVVQADGRDDLGRSTANRGDAGDPFPYDRGGNDAFHAGSTPASRSWRGAASGLTALDIERAAGGIRARILTRFSNVTVEAADSDGAQGLFSVDGAPARPSGHVFRLAPFESVTIEAAAGEILEPGIRRPFDAWDDGALGRSRSLEVPIDDVLLTARYAGREVELLVSASGGEGGIVAGTFHGTPHSDDLWYPEGASVLLEARPRTGFGFDGWTGAFEGQPNPATLDLEAPMSGGAAFDVVYAVATTRLDLVAAEPRDVGFEAVHATDPLSWAITDGALPEGLSLRTSGRLTGAAVETGDFDVTVEARDGIGLRAQGTVRIAVGAPAIEPERAAARLANGRGSLTPEEKRFLDRQGNANGRYDLGDLRAWLQAVRGAGGGP